jgi:nickel transport protein
MKKQFAILALLTLGSAACAHEIWFAQRAGDLALVYGHGAEDLSVIKRIKLITSVGGVDAGGQPVAVTLKPTDHLAFVDVAQAPATLTATMDNGYWTQAADGKWFNKGHDEVPDAKRSGRFLKYSTHLRVLPQGEIKPVPGLDFQLVPASPKFPQHSGDSLVVRVLLNGKPAVGAHVWPDAVNDPDGKPLKVGKDGRVTFKVRNQGLNVIKAEIDSAPVDATKATKTEHAATLSFVLAHQPE